MDSFGWTKQQQQQQVDEGLIMPNTNIFYNCGKTENIRKTAISPIVVQPPPVQKCDPNFPQWNECNSTAGSSWQAAPSINARMLQCEVMNRPSSYTSPQNGIIHDTNHQSMKAAVSLDSLECLLSGSNSHTDTTSGDDDGISMIFSDSNSLWNFQSVPPSASLSNNNDRGCVLISSQSHAGPANQHQNKRKAECQTRNFSFLHSNNPTHGDEHSNSQLKKPRMEKRPVTSSNISFQQASSSTSSVDEPDSEAIAQMKEMIYRAAAFRPVSFGTDDTVEKPKRKNVKISSDPQTVAARQRRERISDRIRVLQGLVPGGKKMDTASMLDEAANYLKFLRSQVKALEAYGPKMNGNFSINGNYPAAFLDYSSFAMQQPQFSIIQNPRPS